MDFGDVFVKKSEIGQFEDNLVFLPRGILEKARL